MAYCAQADVLLFVPQAPGDASFTGYIAKADGVIDARLRDLYVVPITTVDEYLKSISARLAGSYLLSAYHAKHTGGLDPNRYADALAASALEDLEAIRGNPSLLSIAPRSRSGDDAQRCEVQVSDTSDGVFNMGDEKNWG